jgi:hypothetical protein
MDAKEKKLLMEKVIEACDFGIETAGAKHALYSALASQHEAITKVFDYMGAAADYAEQTGREPVLALDQEVSQALVNAQCAMLLVCELMARGAYEGRNDKDHHARIVDPEPAHTLQ